jgi:hypothetical protein
MREIFNVISGQKNVRLSAAYGSVKITGLMLAPDRRWNLAVGKHCARAVKNVEIDGWYKSSSSSSICGAGGNPACRTSAFEAVYTLTPVFSSPVHLHRRTTSDGVRDFY